MIEHFMGRINPLSTDKSADRIGLDSKFVKKERIWAGRIWELKVEPGSKRIKILTFNIEVKN